MSAWPDVVAVLEANYQNPDVEAARALCSAVAAHALRKYPPAWTLVIAPPGSAKTDLLESLRGLPRILFVDEVTPRTFLSGKIDDKHRRRVKPASLLHRIGADGILVAADFSTYTADPKALRVVLAQMRRIYDGNYSREFGSDENLDERAWKGRLTVLAGAVPDVDRHYSIFQSLGERFLRVRWPRAGGRNAALRAMTHTYGLAEKLRDAVHGLLAPILAADAPAEPALSSPMRARIAALSELISLSRSHIERDRYHKDIIGVPVSEGNTRLPQQLCQIARGSAMLDGREQTIESDFGLLCRVAFDSMPLARRVVLLSAIRKHEPPAYDLPPVTASRAIEELQAVGVLRGLGELVTLTPLTSELVEDAAVPGAVLSRKWEGIPEAA